MSGGLDKAEPSGSAEDGSDVGPVGTSRRLTDEPATATSPALAGRTFDNEVASPESTKEQTRKDVTFRYRWNGPPYGILELSTGQRIRPKLREYPQISQLTQDRWSKLLPFWGIPDDQRVSLVLNTTILASLADDEADDVLNTARDQTEVLKLKGSFYSRFTIKDYLPDGRVWSYFDNGVRGRQSGRPDEEITIQLDVGKFSHLDDGAAWGYSLAPWRRFIEGRGLATFVSKKADVYYAFPWFKHGGELSENYRFLRDHLQCRASSAASLETKFQITFFEIVGPTNRNISEAIWPAGPLHSDQQQHWPLESRREFASQDGYDEIQSIGEVYKTAVRYLRESALSIFGVSAMPDLSPNFWTIIMLTPEMWRSWDAGGERHYGPSLYNEDEKSGTSDNNLSLFLVMLRLVETSIAQLCDSKLDALLYYFQQLVSEKSALFNPDVHDSLLSDNETFSRSKTYFWAINMLREIEVSISRNIVEVETCMSVWPSQKYSSEDIESKRSLDAKRQLTPCIEKLSAMKGKFKTLREEAQALRDGLFNASAVMESRASTRLGENVKLLTFVSIFFLPLSFCMSLWSINNTLFSLSALAITATVIALATYIIVFNINNISRGLTKLYTFGSSALVSQIEKERINKDWSDRAEGFKKAKFMSRDQHVVPSKWRLVQYAIIRPKAAFLAMWTAFHPNPKQNVVGKKEGATSAPPEGKKMTTRTGIFRWWWSRSKKKPSEV